MKSTFDYQKLSEISHNLKRRNLSLAICEDGSWAELESGSTIPGIVARTSESLTPAQMEEFIDFSIANPLHPASMGQIRFAR